MDFGTYIPVTISVLMWAAIIYGFFFRLPTDDEAYQRWCDDMDRPKSGDW